MENVDWKYLNDEKKYKIYENGNFVKIKKEKEIEIKPKFDEVKEEFIIKLSVGGEKKEFNAGKLIYETFKGKVTRGYNIKYIDDDSKNINLQNLTLKRKKVLEFIDTDDCKNITVFDDKDFEGQYKINKDGEIMFIKDNKQLSTEFRDEKDYVYLHDTSGKRWRIRVDRLVYSIFVGNIPDYQIIEHIDKDAKNNKLTNLRLKDAKEDIKPDFDFNTISEWVPVYGYENKYIVSKFGEIKNLQTGNKIKPSNCTEDGMYEHIKLKHTNGTIKEYRLHRIMYESFAKKSLPSNIVVDHIDGNKENNKLNNLRAVTQSENTKNRIQPKRKENKIKAQSNNFKNIGSLIDDYDFSNYQVNEYGQVKGHNDKFVIGHVDKGYQLYGLLDKKTNKRITMRGHRIVAAVFLENPDPEKYDVVHHKDGNKSNNHKDNLEWTTQRQNTIYAVGNKKVDKYTLDGKYVCTYNSVSEAMDAHKMKTNKIRLVCNGDRETTGGFKWKWTNEAATKPIKNNKLNN